MSSLSQIIIGSYLMLTCLSEVRAQQRSSEVPRFPEIRIYITKSQFNDLRSSTGVKMELKKAVMLIDNDTAVIKEIQSRGNNSLNFIRKSMAVDLRKALTLKQSGQKLKHFDLMNLVMDQNLWHNRWAFLNMSELNIFPLFNTFCKVWINDQHQGIYLLVEKPNYYVDKIGSPYMIRRGENHKIQKEYKKTDSKEEIIKLRKQYSSIYQNIAHFHGEELFELLNKSMIMDHYYYWLGFNYLFMNGDYADEVFFFAQPKSDLFDIIPWDYDDLVRPAPHEGLKARNEILKDKLIFSSEEKLDQAIALDNYLYKKYLTALQGMLLEQTPQVLKKNMDQVMDELSYLSEDKEAAQATLNLDKDPFEFKNALEHITKAYDFILTRRIWMLNRLANE